jgi:hypothetical protein
MGDEVGDLRWLERRNATQLDELLLRFGLGIRGRCLLKAEAAFGIVSRYVGEPKPSRFILWVDRQRLGQYLSTVVDLAFLNFRCGKPR